MFVSPRETKVLRHPWRRLLCASLFLAALLPPLSAAAQEPRYFRIGTAATGGSFFEIGGVVASAISRPADGPACDRGGSCGVPGLVAVAQATPGSVENLKLVNAGQLESGFAQADIAGWAYKGVRGFADTGAMPKLRSIASLFRQTIHIAVRADSSIRTLADLRGKTVAMGELGSGTALDAALLLRAAGVQLIDVNEKFLRPGPAAQELRDGSVDAMFLVGSFPIPAIRDLAAMTPIRLLPVEGALVDRLKEEFSFYKEIEIPAGTYPGLDGATPSMGFSALWVVNADVDPDLVYAITKSLWNPTTTRLLSSLDPISKGIRVERSLDGISVPLHPGAARHYRETGMSLDGIIETPAPSAGAKGN